MIGALSTVPASRDRLIAAAEAVLKYLRTATPGMLRLMIDPTVGPGAIMSNLDQDPLLVLRGVVNQTLYLDVKKGDLSAARAENVANVLVLALFGISVLETAGFQKNDIVRNVSVTTIVDALWQEQRISKRPRG
jgi:hypothetical protein